MKSKKGGLLLLLIYGGMITAAQQPVPVKPRVIISTDIGGTDPDDNQSMTHFLMYSHLFKTEGLISSPSYGQGNKSELLRMIDLYEKDLPQLQKHQKDYPSPDALRAICKQGRKGAAPFAGYTTATEGSDWIIECAKRKSDQPLWVVVWGGLEDLAQALHDAPEIQEKIKVYWIGGPNKKWSANSYAYIVKHFPGLWFIENNSSYYGFFSHEGKPDTPNKGPYYATHIKATSHLGKDFKNYYKGEVKMGDTPSLLYLMDGDPNDPLRESWGGRFEKLNHSPRIVFERNTSLKDTVTVYSVIEFHFKGPQINIAADSACFTMTVQAEIGKQDWAGYYLGDGNYVVRYCPKRTEQLRYTVSAPIPGFKKQQGQFVVDNKWPGPDRPTDYELGSNWYTDVRDPELFEGIWQGAKTIKKWREEALLDWANRWSWLQ